MIDYSGFKYAKSRPAALDKADKKLVVSVLDKIESAKAKVRAGGKCEVRERGSCAYFRCQHKDTQTHHLKGGIGRRNKGASILADYKLRVCDKCHAAITANVLRPTNAAHDAYTVRYWRAR